MTLSDSVNLCSVLCQQAHAGQKRRDGSPYHKHPVQVARTFDDPLHKCVALLHDVLEDTSETADSLLEKGVPGEVVTHVCRLTHREGERYSCYINRIKSSPVCVAVKIHDIVDNLTDSPTLNQIAKYRAALKQIAGI